MARYFLKYALPTGSARALVAEIRALMLSTFKQSAAYTRADVLRLDIVIPHGYVERF